MTPILYHASGACSQVTLQALHEAELPHELSIIDFATNEQTGERYLAVSPLGKVPALQTSEGVLTENVAILSYIADMVPTAGLLPMATTPFERAQCLSGLSLCSSTLHAIVRGIFRPQRLTTGDGAPVNAMARQLADKNYAWIERKMAEHGWWLGAWSIVDNYLYWTVQTAMAGGYDFARFPTLSGLGDRLALRPAFQRAMMEEQAAIA